MYVEMKNIYKRYGDFLASDNVSFGIEKGKLVALLGPSGSGKTTLLRMIAGLENPNSGDIFIDGKRVNDIPASKRGIGFVFQNYALFRYMTVFDNVAFGLELQKMPKKQIKERVKELLELTGLSGMEKRYPNQLSGGQRPESRICQSIGAESTGTFAGRTVCGDRCQSKNRATELAQRNGRKTGNYEYFRYARSG